MVATDAELMSWVEEQLQRNPEVTVDELFEGAKELNPDVAELNKRQFHARYPLQVKRRAKRAAMAAQAGTEEVKKPAKRGATTDAEVMSWVDAELKSNPQVSVDELLAGALKLNPAIAELSKRQFHARYPLQVKRAARRAADAAAGIKPRRRRRTAPAPAPEPEPEAAPPAEEAPAPEPAAEAAPEAPAEAAPEAVSAPEAAPAPAPEAAPAAAPEAEPAAAPEPAPAPAPEAAPALAGLDREVMRKVFFAFAADITAAEGTTGVVRVLAALDDYIDQVAG